MTHLRKFQKTSSIERSSKALLDIEPELSKVKGPSGVTQNKKRFEERLKEDGKLLQKVEIRLVHGFLYSRIQRQTKAET